MKRIAVLTSGGDAPGMNAAIRSVVRCGIDEGMQVYGVFRGFEGLIDGDIKEMSRVSVADILQRGGTILKTARSKNFMTDKGFEKALLTLRTFKIDGLVIIGGNGSLKGAEKLSENGIKVMGIPGTIDNDCGYTDFTIGFDTAVNTVLNAITTLRDTSSAHERTTVIEVMGRECGDIALYAGIAGGAEYALLPEVEADIDDLCMKVVQGVNRGKEHSIIIKAEGYPVKSETIVEELSRLTGREVRLVVLSYLQRGGSPTLRDRMLATLCGSKAVDLFKNDSPSKALGEIGGEIAAYDLHDAVLQEREIDMKMYKLIDVLSR